jgi:hypothetical protein
MQNANMEIKSIKEEHSESVVDTSDMEDDTKNDNFWNLAASFNHQPSIVLNLSPNELDTRNKSVCDFKQKKPNSI